MFTRIAILVVILLSTVAGRAEEAFRIHFENADVGEVISLYERVTGSKVVRDESATGRITFSDRGTLSGAEAIKALERGLYSQGYAVIESGTGTMTIFGPERDLQDVQMPTFIWPEVPQSSERVFRCVFRLNSGPDYPWTPMRAARARTPKPMLVEHGSKKEQVTVIGNSAAIENASGVLKEHLRPKEERIRLNLFNPTSPVNYFFTDGVGLCNPGAWSCTVLLLTLATGIAGVRMLRTGSREHRFLVQAALVPIPLLFGIIGSQVQACSAIRQLNEAMWRTEVDLPDYALCCTSFSTHIGLYSSALLLPVFLLASWLSRRMRKDTGKSAATISSVRKAVSLILLCLLVATSGAQQQTLPRPDNVPVYVWPGKIPAGTQSRVRRVFRFDDDQFSPWFPLSVIEIWRPALEVSCRPFAREISVIADRGEVDFETRFGILIHRNREQFSLGIFDDDGRLRMSPFRPFMFDVRWPEFWLSIIAGVSILIGTTLIVFSWRRPFRTRTAALLVASMTPVFIGGIASVWLFWDQIIMRFGSAGSTGPSPFALLWWISWTAHFGFYCSVLLLLVLFPLVHLFRRIAVRKAERIFAAAGRK